MADTVSSFILLFRKNSEHGHDSNMTSGGEGDTGERDGPTTVPAGHVGHVSFRDMALMVPIEPGMYDSMVIHGQSRNSDLITEL